ncbi:MAG: TatD family hydrolase, partial [Firmicutes bacterium]|nr:TatD family hydrolase [Bacillota bacterium]
IHSREADQEVMDILKEEGAFSNERKSWFPKRPDPTGYVNGGASNASGDAGMCDDARVLLHCYSGSAELGRQYVKLGATLSIAGPVTYKNNKKTIGVVEEVPIDFLLIETDSPYLTPEPFRGKKNNPSLVEYTARKVAEIKGMSYEDVANITKVNAMRFYGIK